MPSKWRIMQILRVTPSQAKNVSQYVVETYIRLPAKVFLLDYADKASKSRPQLREPFPFHTLCLPLVYSADRRVICRKESPVLVAHTISLNSTMRLHSTIRVFPCHPTSRLYRIWNSNTIVEEMKRPRIRGHLAPIAIVPGCHPVSPTPSQEQTSESRFELNHCRLLSKIFLEKLQSVSKCGAAQEIAAPLEW
jgi:hypothetical protein